MKKDRKTQEELANLGDTIRQNVADIIKNKSRINSSDNTNFEPSDDDFWNLGSPKPKVYKKPDFSDNPIEMTDIAPLDEPSQNTTKAETIAPPPDNFSARFATVSYRKHGNFSNFKTPSAPKRPPEKISSVKYSGNGLLIREVEVLSPASDIDFYERFVVNAQKSHDAKSTVPYTSPYPEVKFFSYVPQYAHMSREQIDFYHWVRENIRHGRYPSCDCAYIQLYIYEILNLSDRIPPNEGAELLASLWLNYRKKDSRFDGNLGEWLPDYCMIHNCPLPRSVYPLLPEIVPKTPFKEFYFDVFDNTEDKQAMLLFAKTLIETSSDYDFRKSRYYADNREAFDTHIPLAVAEVIAQSIRTGNGIIARRKTYKMMRDSYSGAVVSSHIKRRLRLEFCSFTRSVDTRQNVTAVVKYAENKLRLTLGIKAKLGVGDLSPDESAIIDNYFAPLIPKKKSVSIEDRYMPADYMKNYEADDSGFDFKAAIEIERASWQNTDLLTRGELDSEVEDAPEIKTETPPDIDEKIEKVEEIEKIEKVAEVEKSAETKKVEKSDTSDGDTFIRNALNAALCGSFHGFCRENGIYDGVLADRINTKFIDIIGDVVLEESGVSYIIIEDYREDIETWTKNQS